MPAWLPRSGPPLRSFSAQDPSHSFPTNGRGLRRLLRLVAPSLQDLLVAQCSDIFQPKSFEDLAALQVRPPTPSRWPSKGPWSSLQAGCGPAAKGRPGGRTGLGATELKCEQSAPCGGTHHAEALQQLLTC